MNESANTAKDDQDAAFFAWPAPRPGAPAVSVVAPMFNEAGGAALLVAEISDALEHMDREIILVDDGSSDETAAELRKSPVRGARVLRHKYNAGQSRALRTGVLAARSDVIVMLDGDGQNNPADIPALLNALQDSAPNVAMVAGERKDRQDAAAKRWASSLANGLRKRVLRDGADDTGCGLKAFRREAYLRLPYFDHMHRYLPALMRREGFAVKFVPVSHRPRVHGASKYTNIGRFLVAIRDLMGVSWLLGRLRSPGAVEELER